MSATVPVTVRIPVEVRDQLEQLAQATARSRSWLAAEAIGVFVRSERQFLDAVAEGRQAASRGDMVDHDKVGRWLDSWGRDGELPPPTE